MRLFNRPLAFVLAAALVVAGAILIIEVIAYGVSGDPVIAHWPTWLQWAHRTQWNQAVVKTWSIILMVLGAVILALQLKPKRVSRLKVHADHQATDAAVTRPGLGGAVRAAVLDIDGVSKAAVTVRRGKVSVAATSSARDAAVARQLVGPVTEAAEQRLASLQLAHEPRVQVRVATRSN